MLVALTLVALMLVVRSGAFRFVVCGLRFVVCGFSVCIFSLCGLHSVVFARGLLEQ